MSETLKIKALPAELRPREIFMRSANPQKDLSDELLLAIVIRTGRKGTNAIELANRLIKHFGNSTNLVNSTWQQIVAAKIPGIGKVVAIQLAAAFALVKRNVRISQRAFKRKVLSSKDVVRQVLSVGIDERQENTFVLYLDTQRHLLCEPVLVFRGVVDATLLHPREIFRHAILLGASSLIVAHTHPSGDASPSDEDLKATKKIIKTGQLVGIPVDDHVIIGCGTKQHISIRGLGNISFND